MIIPVVEISAVLAGGWMWRWGGRIIGRGCWRITRLYYDRQDLSQNFAPDLPDTYPRIDGCPNGDGCMYCGKPAKPRHKTSASGIWYL
jgi:hypothetical protein